MLCNNKRGQGTKTVKQAHPRAGDAFAGESSDELSSPQKVTAAQQMSSGLRDLVDKHFIYLVLTGPLRLSPTHREFPAVASDPKHWPAAASQPASQPASQHTSAAGLPSREKMRHLARSPVTEAIHLGLRVVIDETPVLAFYRLATTVDATQSHTHFLLSRHRSTGARQ